MEKLSESLEGRRNIDGGGGKGLYLLHLVLCVFCVMLCCAILQYSLLYCQYMVRGASRQRKYDSMHLFLC